MDGIDALILTHFHIDHVSGVPFLLSGLYHLARTQKLRVYGLEDTLDRLRTALELLHFRLHDEIFPVEYYDLKGIENELLFDESGFKVTSTPVLHSIPNIGLRFEAGDKSVVYSSDTEPSDALVRLAQDCDLLIHESSGAAAGHSTPQQAAQTAQIAHAKSLLLIHYLYQTGIEEELLEQARPYFQGEIVLAKDFMKISL